MADPSTYAEKAERFRRLAAAMASDEIQSAAMSQLAEAYEALAEKERQLAARE
jgi:hypothetical protein